MRNVAHRNIKAHPYRTPRVQPRLRAAGIGARPVSSPARALHGSLSRQFEVPEQGPAQGTIGQRIGMIALFAAMSWTAIGTSAFYLIH